jgi:hypothetical protein
MSIARQRSLSTFPHKQMRGTIEHLLLGNGAENRLCQKYRLFSVGSVQFGYKTVESSELVAAGNVKKGISLCQEDFEFI